MIIRTAPKNYCKFCMELNQPWLAYFKERIRSKFHNIFGFVARNGKEKTTFLCTRSLSLGYSKIPRELFNFPLQSQFHSTQFWVSRKTLVYSSIIGQYALPVFISFIISSANFIFPFLLALILSVFTSCLSIYLPQTIHYKHSVHVLLTVQLNCFLFVTGMVLLIYIPGNRPAVLSKETRSFPLY